MNFTIFIICALFSFSTRAFAQTAATSNRFTVSSDQQYYVYDDGFYRYIYPASDRPLLKKLIFYNSKIRDLYQKDFGWNFDERPYLILASNQNQIANGETTIFPRLFTVFYPGGAQIPNEFSANSWVDMLLSHETSHMYQLDQKQEYSALLKKYFGNTTLSSASLLTLPFTYMEYPNEYLPTFLLEGNAMLNESQFGNGGRLYNGSDRAMVFALAKAGLINSTRLMNDHLYFPFTNEKYWVGGYLQAWLANKYGIKSVDHYFYQHAFDYVNPLDVNDSFERAFGIGYETAIWSFLHHWRTLYSTQKSSSSPTLFSSQLDCPIANSDNEIRFLTTDAETEPIVHIYNIKSGTWSNRRVDLPIGLVFRDDKGRLVSASAQQINNNNIKAGLFADGYTLWRPSENKYVYDKQGSHLLYADAKKSFAHFSLWSGDDNQSNQTKIGTTVSSAIFGPDLTPYYFQQNQKDHVLYAGQKALFSYKGYWGFPVDVDAGGAVYFIAPVKRGSSLFEWQNGKFTRLTDSDVVVDARLINSHTAVVNEVSATGYHYKIIQLKSISQAPYEYKYKFESSPNFHLFDQPAKAATFDSKNEKPYSSWRYLSYEGLDPSATFGFDSVNGLVGVGGLNAHFSDPLQDQNLSMSVMGGSYDFAQTTLSYLNSQYVLNWDLAAQYTHDTDQSVGLNGKTNITARYNSWIGTGGVTYPFFVRPQWVAEAAENFLYQDNQDPLRGFYDANQYVNLSRLAIDHQIAEPLGFDSYRNYSLELDDEWIHDAPKWTTQTSVYSGEASIEYDLWRETYLSGSYQDSFTDGRSAMVQLRNAQDPYLLPTTSIVYRLSNYPDQYYYELRRSTVELKQAFDDGLYFVSFPLSMRRFAVLARYSRYDGATAAHASPGHLFDEAGAGLEVEFLLANKYPFRVTWLDNNSSVSGWNSLIMAGAHASF